MDNGFGRLNIVYGILNHPVGAPDHGTDSRLSLVIEETLFLPAVTCQRVYSVF